MPALYLRMSLCIKFCRMLLFGLLYVYSWAIHLPLTTQLHDDWVVSELGLGGGEVVGEGYPPGATIRQTGEPCGS